MALKPPDITFGTSIETLVRNTEAIVCHVNGQVHSITMTCDRIGDRILAKHWKNWKMQRH